VVPTKTKKRRRKSYTGMGAGSLTMSSIVSVRSAAVATADATFDVHERSKRLRDAKSVADRLAVVLAVATEICDAKSAGARPTEVLKET
jgi:hypothetical protein